MNEEWKQSAEEDLTADMPLILRQSAPKDEDLDDIIARIMSEDDFGTSSRYLQGVSVPVFEEPAVPEKCEEPKEDFMPSALPIFSNAAADPADTLAARAEKRERERREAEELFMAELDRDDKWQVVLMSVASGLCLGIIGMMIYWICRLNAIL